MERMNIKFFGIYQESNYFGSDFDIARSLCEFGATLIFAGNIPEKTQTIPTAIYVAMESGEMNLAWA
jgi:molybdate transport system permease protein